MVKEIELYVSATGLDSNDGSKAKPFATVQKAVCEVRKLIADGLKAPVTVYLGNGRYDVDKLELTEKDSGTAECPVKYCALGDGEVIFCNGVFLDTDKFVLAEGEIAKPLPAQARKNVYVYDLKQNGITLAENGAIAVKGHINAKDIMPYNCEVFWNDHRMKVSRYPNEGFLPIQDVCDDNADEATIAHRNEYKDGKTIVIDADTAERMKNWKHPERIWMYGYFYHDWASASSAVAGADPEHARMFMCDASGYGVQKGGTYYCYNVLEELDAPGEYYIDSDNLLLYVYPTSDVKGSTAMISLSCNPIIIINKAEYVTFEGITLEGARNKAICLDGNNCTIKNCKILNIYDWAILVNGYNNLIYGCEITRTGRGGITITGGDRATLTPGNNVAENNYIHDWPEVFLTYSSGIELFGCGNKAVHNDLINTTHMAIYYNGNDHLIEYNHIKNAVQLSHDAGAVYGGRDWAAYGCVMRYNLLENIGNDKFFPDGIYWDDTQSGQRAYGNIIKNATGKAFLIGGGRDNVVENNIMIGGEYPMLYDERGIEGVVANGWYTLALKGAYMWETLKHVPIHSKIWLERYPNIAKINDNYDNVDDIDFGPNPSRAVIKNNICVFENDYGFFVAPTVQKFGTVENNLLFKKESECMVEGKQYQLKPEVKAQLPEFEDIPVDKIGRYKL